jgi:hypothetical protein
MRRHLGAAGRAFGGGGVASSSCSSAFTSSSSCASTGSVGIEAASTSNPAESCNRLAAAISNERLSMALESVLETALQLILESAPELVPESAPKLVLEVVLTKLEQKMATDELVLCPFAQIRCPKKETGMKHRRKQSRSKSDDKLCVRKREMVRRNYRTRER